MAKVSAETGLRWEWRSFGRNFGSAEQYLAELTPGRIQESDEIYLLTGSGDNVKVRDELMDVKVLQQVDAEGLEQWAPVLKAGFPLSRADAARVLDALRIPAPASLEDSYTLDAFLEAFAGEGKTVQAVPVHKRRVRYTVNGCMAELSDVSASGKSTRTIAVESEDAAAVVGAVAELGLSGYANVSYPRALAALIDDAPECYSVIDVGTNSVKFHVAARDPSGSWRTLVDRAEVTRLGEGLEKGGVIGNEPIERTAAAVSVMVDEARRHGVRAIAAVGTAGLRIAANAADVLAAIRARTGVGIEIISGEDEARLAFLGATAALEPGPASLVVFDTGGGSSQFTFGHGGQIDERFSVNVGAARFTERFGLSSAVSRDVLDQAMAQISTELARLDGNPRPDVLVGMGGVLTNSTAVRHGLATYDPAVVQGSILDLDEIDRQIELYRSRDADARRSIVGLQPKRAEVILAGACIVRVIMQKLGSTSLQVSDRGLRHGVLAERFGQ
jgi:exopolyphosphatase / guanosine-5'-triphosphate,3'-diphosphate pyrophosphatase